MTVQPLSPAAVPTAVRNPEAVLARYGPHGRRWLDGMRRGDPRADAVVADGGSLTTLFDALDTPPAWLDHDRCDRAAGHLARQSREYGLVLGAASLVAGAQNHVAGKPLTFTGRYATQAAVRSIEVGSWVTAVTTPGGMRRDGAGFERTVRVRMIHAHVRAHLMGHADWDEPAWGIPIPQPYMAFTLAEFGSIALRAMRRLGVRYTARELDDIYHLWRYVGHLVGMGDDINPVTAADHHRAEALYALTSPGPDDGDRTFVAALTAFQAGELAKVLPPGLRDRAPSIMHGLQRAFVGDATADSLSIPNTRFRRLPALLGPVTAAAYGAHDRVVPNGKARRTARGFRNRAQELARLRAEYGVEHELVDDAPAAAA